MANKSGATSWYLTVTLTFGSVLLGSTALHICRFFGSDPEDARTYALCAVVGFAAVMLNQTIGVAADSFHFKADEIEARWRR